MKTARIQRPHPRFLLSLLIGGTVVVVVAMLWTRSPRTNATFAGSEQTLLPRTPRETSGFALLLDSTDPWEPTATLPEIAECWERLGYRGIADLDDVLKNAQGFSSREVDLIFAKAACFNYEGKPEEANAVLEELRAKVELHEDLKHELLASVLYLQGVTAFRGGETANCVLCRGESSCILPINPAAVHKNPEGSRLAIKHFTEYLQHFPDDLEVKWLLNLGHMTLGEHPEKVDPRYLVSLDRFQNPQESIGKFRDVGHLLGVNRFNQAGGAIMEDFDNDGLLDLAVTSFDPRQVMEIYCNKGDGTFEARGESAGIEGQLGGLTCVQTDYNNDGLMDIYIPRGAWLNLPVRPSLLRNDGNLHFTDVTAHAGLLDPVNSNAALWADYDNDGWLDLFVCCEKQHHRLYRNLGNGRFQEVPGAGGIIDLQTFGKGCTWIDYDNDDYPDMYVQYLNGESQLYHNERNGLFRNVTSILGDDSAEAGFSCWAFDYDNDGWLDIFATSYDRSLKDVVKGLLGEPHACKSNRLFRNLGGNGFQDVAPDVGLDMVFSTMGSNYGDFDNDGFLDMYLGTGDPQLNMLVPNRMFRNISGRRFAEITGSAGVGHLQKGHGVACGDWNRDGNVDIFIEMGGATPGDRYHNVLFQNPGHDNHWLTVKLIGKKTNRAALGARIKVVTAGDKPLTIHRHVSPGSSFGSSPLEQTIGVGSASKIASLEIHWPTSQTTQVFHDVAVDQVIEVTEFSENYQTKTRKAVPVPE